MDNPMLKTFGRKMGISSEEALQKASEFRRVVGVRCGSGSLASLNMTSSCAAVICLEISATSCGLATDKKTAVKLSGMQQKLYTNAYKAIECILGKEKKFSIRDLAVMFGCVSSVSLAQQLLDKFSEKHNGRVDCNKPIFIAASLYVVCRSERVRIDKTKLLNQINEKKSMFDKVCNQFKDILEKMPVKTKENRSKRPYSWLENSLEEEMNNDVETKKTRTTEKDMNDKRDTDYEQWKLKMLGAA